jgi:hypothetical protein
MIMGVQLSLFLCYNLFVITKYSEFMTVAGVKFDSLPNTVIIVAFVALISFCWILNYVIEKVENLNLVGAAPMKKNGNRRVIALSGMKTGSATLTNVVVGLPALLS